MCSPPTSLPGGPRLGEASQAAWVGGGWGVVGREEPSLGSAVAAVAARIAPEGPEEKSRPRASPPASPRSARERPACFCVGRCGRGSAARLTAEFQARNPEAATLLRRGPANRRARRRCGPWIKEAAAWEEEDGGWQERRQLRGDYFFGSFD